MNLFCCKVPLIFLFVYLFPSLFARICYVLTLSKPLDYTLKPWLHNFSVRQDSCNTDFMNLIVELNH